MIFVTVGNDFRSFDRLLKRMDEIAPALPEEVIIQRGYSRFRPVNARSFDFVSMEKAIEYIKASRLVVSHAGIGTIMLCKEYGIPMIILPRRKRFQEHINDHQIEIVGALEERKDENIYIVYDEHRLKEKVMDVLERAPRYAPMGNAAKSNLIRTIREFIEKT
jgi:beta-1,4-N-acetylglucosaminyltransferase